MSRIAILVLSLMILNACGSDPSRNGTIVSNSPPPIRGVPIDKVLTRVKQEIGLFYSDGAKAEQNWPQLLRDLKVTPVCGDGHIAFEITSVKMEFTVTSEQSGKAGAGLKIPFGPVHQTGNVSPGLGGGRETSGTIDLVYTYKPLPNGPLDDRFDAIRDKAVILPALDQLRDGLIKATGQRPCFRSLGPEDHDQTLTFSVAVSDDASGSLGFNFLLLNASASADNSNMGKNTITISYRPVRFRR